MIQWLINQHRAMSVVFVAVFILGYLSLGKLGKEELPEFGGSGLNISVFLPGASPEEMDSRVARLLQNQIKDIPGVDEVSSSSRQGAMNLSQSQGTPEIRGQIRGQYTYLLPDESLARFLIGILSPELSLISTPRTTQMHRCDRN